MGKSNNNKRHIRPQIVDHVSDSDDEEIPEDEAFNSDDERKYGSFFENDNDKVSMEDEESSEDDDDEEDSQDGDGGQYMLDLLDKLDDDKERGQDEKKQKSISPHVKESQFSSSVIKKAGLTLDNLMDGLEDTKGFGLVQKAMKKVSRGQATAAPVAKVVSNRAERKVHYQLQSKEVSQWSRAVHENRKAETLDFRPKQRLEVTRDVLVDKFVPTTDFEKALHETLQQAGQEDEEAMLKAEEDALNDDLGSSEITMDEFKKRRGQLAKMRALMFYHEQKRHHINKIKSKKYRRIRKKQRERLKDAETEAEMEENPDLARELQEKEEMERMKERASLAHKNTSKWAKRILKRGKNVDVDTRRALSAQLKRGDDLLQRMNSTTRNGDSEDDDDDDEDLVETARKVLADTEDDNETTDNNNTGLFKLSFMQRGVERQRQKAKQEARQLLMELEANEEEAEESDNDDDKAQRVAKKKRAKSASKDEMKSLLNEGDLMASSLKFGTSNPVAVSGNIDIDVGFHDDQKTEKAALPGDRLGVNSTTISSGEVIRTTTTSSSKKTSNSSQKQKKKAAVSTPASTTTQEDNNDDANPWLATNENSETAKEDATSKPTNKQGKKRKSATVSSSKRGFVDVDRAVDLLESTPPAQPPVDIKKPAAEWTEETPPDRKITTLTQEELVRKAFAAATDKDAEEEFAKEKAVIEEREDPTRKIKGKEKDMGESSGWGSWAGQGAPPPRPPRKFPKKLQPPERTKVKRKRVDEKKPGVIISQKRIKKTADKFLLSQIPYPFTSREDYERSMTGGVGREWNVTSSFKDMTRPEVYTRAGKVIQPISKKVKQKRAPAKF